MFLSEIEIENYRTFRAVSMVLCQVRHAILNDKNNFSLLQKSSKCFF